MITDPKTAAWLDLLDPGDPAPLEALRAEAEQAEVPVVSRVTESLLKAVIAMKRPERVLEIGTAVGFSALVMCSVLPETAKIDTIEHWAPRIEAARKGCPSVPPPHPFPCVQPAHRHESEGYAVRIQAFQYEADAAGVRGHAHGTVRVRRGADTRRAFGEGGAGCLAWRKAQHP